MKSFFKAVLATMVGIMFLWILMFFTLLIIGVASLTQTPTTVKSNSVLELDLNGIIKDRTIDNPLLKLYDNSSSQEIGLDRILTAIKNAETDDNIKGISLNVNQMSASYATAEEIRNALLSFKSSGKFIYAYAEFMTQMSYYLATASDSIFIYPQGRIDIRGISTTQLFFHQLLEKIDIEPQIVRHGEFKSAIEPFVLDKMSKANREQMQAIVTSLWSTIRSDIASSRNVSEGKIDQIADNLRLLYDTEFTISEHLIDGFTYKDEYEALLKKKLKIEKTKKINKVSLSEYAKSAKNPKTSSHKIAVIYALGSIVDADGDNENIGHKTAKEISKARQDKNIKAIVLRVNSGGGSALMSDLIWREVLLAKKEKPLVVSMGNLAASGGYYISCAADYIVAQPTTLTGSIGVFGVIPNIQDFLSKKLGITTDVVKTNIHSDGITLMRPMTTYEYAALQKNVENVYDVFVQRVADGRNMTAKQVDAIGQGRVWTGSDALKIGLVDTLGGLDVAIKIAAQKAKLKEYMVIEKPIIKDFLQEITSSLMEANVSKQNMLQTKLINQYNTYIEIISQLNGVQARMPFIINIE